MGEYFRQKNIRSASTHFYLNQTLPEMESFDWLIIMGGAMSANDDAIYPWLTAEKKFIKDAIDAGKVVIGVCLGAQLIAASLGAKIYQNKYKEIGWFDLTPSEEAKDTILGNCFSKKMEVFHWHGDTFDLPKGAVHLASSEATKNQGFIMDNRVIGFQFHLETTYEYAKALFDNFPDEIKEDGFIQNAQEVFSDLKRFERINKIMAEILETIQKANG
ncbi:MAG: glutamine amidotransferase [Planctomycetes bacterium ADurb.Bin401]|nr:MAG: glutamine amidotransferase [Planctomycetes bacterium ADurb.Bin401]